MTVGRLDVAVLVGLLVVVPGRVYAQEGLRARLGVERAIATLEGARDASERRAAARFLGRSGAADRASSALATAIVVEADRDVRIEIADALARRGTTLASAAIAERLVGAPDEERRALMRALGAARDPLALETLALELGGMPDGALAADLLVRAGPDARPALSSALADPVRRAPALEALGRSGDPSAAAEIAAMLDDEDAPVRSSAAQALAMLGDPDGALAARLEDADDALAGVILRSLAGADRAEPDAGLDRASPGPALIPLAEARLGASEPGTRAGALLFLAARDPARAVAPLTAGLADTPEVRAAVREALAGSSDAALVPVARELATRSERGSLAHDLAIDFLVRARGGAGLGTLLELEATPVAVALALRRHAGATDWARAYAALLEHTTELARDVLATLAGAPTRRIVFDAHDPLERALAGACAWLSPDVDAEGLGAALGAEADARAFVWLAHAAVAHRVPIPAATLRRWLERPDRRADALPLVPSSIPSATPSEARALRRAVSAALLGPDPRERAAAARVLGALTAVESSAALESALDDPSDTVRVAAARALTAIDPARATVAVAAAARVAHDGATARALASALKPTASPDVLVLRIETAGDLGATPWLDVRTCDGVWLRLPALPGGLVVVADVPCVSVDADLVWSAE